MLFVTLYVMWRLCFENLYVLELLRCVRLCVLTLRHVTCTLCSNIPEADAPWHRLLSVQRLQFRPEEVRRESETAGRLVKDGDQVVRDDVTIRVCNI